MWDVDLYFGGLWQRGGLQYRIGGQFCQNTGTDAVTTAAEQLLGHSDTDGKEETVYVIADANGKPDQVIVSEWLKNGDGKDTLKDVSNLENIQNVKGDQDYTRAAATS